MGILLEYVIILMALAVILFIGKYLSEKICSKSG
jgi:hypothetical protein